MQLPIRRWLRALEASPVLLVGFLTTICLPAVLLLAWSVANRWESDRIDATIERQLIYLERAQKDAQHDFETVFGRVRPMLQWLSEEVVVTQALASGLATPGINGLLQRLADGFGLDLVYVLDTTGLCIASSNAETDVSLIGSVFADRMYFRDAIKGDVGRQFAIGRITRVPGFFFAMPVRRLGRVIGVVAVKIDQESMAEQIRINNGLVTDDMGVVMLADNPDYLMKVLPSAPALTADPATLEKRYGRAHFQKLSLEPYTYRHHSGLYLLDGDPVLLQSRVRATSGLTVHLFAPLFMLQEVAEQRRMLFMGITFGGTIAMWGIFASFVFYMRARSYRVHIEEVNVQLEELNSELQKQASHDYLTGCLNRRSFSGLLSTEIVRAQRYGTPLSLAIIDIDHFKRINDVHGHVTGDMVLQHLVTTLSHIMRKIDSLARLGGEEFALLMPNTPEAEAHVVVDRMRQHIAQDSVPDTEPKVSFTFSAGVAEYEDGMDHSAFLSKADNALYEAKGAGRNRTIMAGGNRSDALPPDDVANTG